MKKLTTFLMLIGMSAFLFGQTYLSENFSGGQMPPTGWSIDAQAAQWSASISNKAGGVTPEAKFHWAQGTATSRLISPEIDLTGLSSITFNFSHFLNDYNHTDYSLGVATTSNGSGVWTDVWTLVPTGNIPAETVSFEINNADVGNTDFQICIYFSGNMYNFNDWFIDDIILFVPFDLDAQLSVVNTPQYALINNDIDLTGTVKNMGNTNITTFEIAYTVDGGSPNVYTISGIDLGFGETYYFTHNTPLNLPDAGIYEIITTVQNVNGGDDDNPDNNTITSTIGAVSSIPEKKVFGEEVTGTWCSWCVRGICAMDYMAENYPENWIGVAVHNNDPMVNTVYDAAIRNYIAGYPSALVDRAVGNIDPADMEAHYLKQIEAISPATIEIVDFSFDQVTRVVDFNLKALFVTDINHELRFNAVIAEDSLYGTASNWAQANAYSGGGNGVMCGFENLPNPVPAADMHYDHVAREILGGWAGNEGSLPLAIANGSTHFFNYTYTIPEDWIFEKLHFIGLLIDQTTGVVLNANNVINYSTGVEKPTIANEVKIFPNPTKGLVYIKGANNSTVQVYNANGSLVATYKYFSSKHLDLSNLDNGIYFINIKTESGEIINKKVNVLK